MQQAPSASTDTRTDSVLIAAAQAGNTAAFGTLVWRHQQAAIRVAAIALGSSTGADDVAQEAFVKAHQALAGFNPGKPFQPWLFRIVSNTARNARRTHGRQRALALRTGYRAPIEELQPDELAAHNADRNLLVEAINRLRMDDRLILTYRWYDELSEAEIAHALGCRAGTVKSRLNRAMKRLRTEMEIA